MPSVITNARRNPRRSSRRIARTPIWHVMEDAIRISVAGTIRLSAPSGVVRRNGLRSPAYLVGGHTCVATLLIVSVYPARIEK